MAYAAVRSGAPPVSNQRNNQMSRPYPRKNVRTKEAKEWRRNYEKVIQMAQSYVSIVGEERSRVLADKLRVYLGHVHLDYKEYIINKTGKQLTNKYFEHNARNTQKIPMKKTFTDLLKEAKEEEQKAQRQQIEVSGVASLRVVRNCGLQQTTVTK